MQALCEKTDPKFRSLFTAHLNLNPCKIMREVELYSFWKNSSFESNLLNESVGLVHKAGLKD